MNNITQFKLLRTLIVSASILLIMPFGMSQDSGSKKKDYATFSLDNNHFNGVYQEKYKNGKVKITGHFKDGQRVGLWSAWDSTGVLKVQRNYINNKQFDFVFPNKKSAEVLKKDSELIYPYQKVEESDVAYSFRVWRLLDEKNEANLFKQVQFKLVAQSLLSKDASWYLYGKAADFEKEITGSDLKILQAECQNWDFNRIEIKEDFFVTKNNSLGETRQIAISFFKNKEDSKPAYTVYCPTIRKELSAFKITNGVVREVTNLDDLLFMKAYRGQIVNSSNLNRYEKMEKREADIQTELDLLSNEHDYWLSFGK